MTLATGNLIDMNLGIITCIDIAYTKVYQQYVTANIDAELPRANMVYHVYRAIRGVDKDEFATRMRQTDVYTNPASQVDLFARQLELKLVEMHFSGKVHEFIFVLVMLRYGLFQTDPDIDPIHPFRSRSTYFSF